ncbi:hypothetical protein [Chengkuizengella marina]|uniref:Uncharacterized protein n=1 Tax=Chengkuizengella marina TaxID=2507566 RepID=A0A6N9Q7P5_9BACL|nr:hypothetical protein [Chengkuizengella marina]NBI30896.1 hypothetical protein [Chengkuizengella marina]
MSQKFDSQNEKIWLQNNNEKIKEDRYKLGVKAIDALISEEKPISYRSISNKSKELDIKNKGIHPNTIKNNKKLYEYYIKHSSSKKLTKRHSRKHIKIGDHDFKSIKIDRDVERVKRRYMQLNKLELVELLINAEQYIAEQNQIWIKSQFESFK